MLKVKSAFWAAPQTWASLITSCDVSPAQPYTERPVNIIDGVAVVDVCGVLMREESDMCEYFGGASTVRISRQIAAALKDMSVRAILLHINSPGGEVNGTAELAEQILAARAVKPVVAYISGDGYSAGYWLASQAQRIFIHNAAGAGALGVCYPVEVEAPGDERTVWLVSNVSPKKHPSVDSPEAVNQMQSFLNDLGAIFISAVARGRGISEPDVLAKYGQGDIFIAAKAVAAGLCDEVADFNAALSFAQGAKAQTAATLSQSPDGVIENQNQNAPAGETTTQGENMADKTTTTTPPKTDAPAGEMVNTSDITVDWIKTNLPDVYDQIVNGSADAEAERQAGLDDMSASTEAEIAAVKAARKDRKQNAATLALAFHKAAQAERDAKIKAEREARAQDNGDVIIPVNSGTQAAKTAAQVEDDRTIAAMKRRRGVT